MYFHRTSIGPTTAHDHFEISLINKHILAISTVSRQFITHTTQKIALFPCHGLAGNEC